MPPFTTAILSETGKAAYQALLAADQFEESFIGIAAQPSHLVVAYRTLLKETEADSAFKQLLEQASPAGQLYALCGVYFTDPASFPALVEKNRNRSEPVRVQSGCLGFGVPFADILADKSPQAVRLSGPDASLMEWRRDHPDCNKFDIVGGGYPHAFTQSFAFG